MFFVLNVGRSGSRTVAQVLSQAKGCRCLHEPHPQLIAEATQYRTGELDHASVVELLRRTRHEGKGEQYGETANKLAYVVPPLRDAFPDAKLVWLVRDGRDVVSSAMQRGWYGPDEQDPDAASEWGAWRPQGHLVGAMSAEAWASMDQFARMCWLWSYANGLIKDEAGAPYLLRLETLDEQLPDLCSFLDLPMTDFHVPRANRRILASEVDQAADAKRSNVVDHIASWREWTDDQREVFDHWCGPLMDELFPMWRSGPAGPAGEPRPGTDNESATGEGPSLQLVHDALSEFRVRRGEVASLEEERRRLERDRRALREELDEARTQLEHAGRLQREVEALRVELEASRDEARTATSIQDALERELRNARKRLEAAETAEQALVGAQDELARMRLERARDVRREQVRAEQAEAALRAFRGSRAYRVARLLQRIAGLPRRAVRGLASALLAIAPRRVAARMRRVLSRIGRPQRATLGDTYLVAQRVIDIPPLDRSDEPAPLIGVASWGASPEALERLLDTIERLALVEGRRFSVLHLTDTTAFHVFRARRAVFEYIPPREEFARHHSDIAYAAFVENRVDEIVRTFRPDQIISVDGSQLRDELALGTLRAAVVDITARFEMRRALAQPERSSA